MYRFFTILLIGLCLAAGCRVPQVGTVSATPVPTGKYKLSSSAINATHRFVTVLGIPTNDLKDYGLLAKEAQDKGDCAYLRNVRLEYASGGFMGIGIQTYSVTGECWVKE